MCPCALWLHLSSLLWARRLVKVSLICENVTAVQVDCHGPVNVALRPSNPMIQKWVNVSITVWKESQLYICCSHAHSHLSTKQRYSWWSSHTLDNCGEHRAAVDAVELTHTLANAAAWLPVQVTRWTHMPGPVNKSNHTTDSTVHSNTTWLCSSWMGQRATQILFISWYTRRCHFV